MHTDSGDPVGPESGSVAGATASETFKVHRHVIIFVPEPFGISFVIVIWKSGYYCVI